MIKFYRNNDELILEYTPAYGIESILDKIDSLEEYTIKDTFEIKKEDIINWDNIDESIQVVIGKYINGYIEINKRMIGTNNRFYISEDITVNIKLFIANSNISILRKIDDMVDKDVYIGGEEKEEYYCFPKDYYKNFINLFPNSYELKRYANSRIAQLIKEVIPCSEKHEKLYNRLIEKKEKNFFENNDLYYIENYERKIRLENFSIVLSELKILLGKEKDYGEKMWQEKVEKILQLLYPQYILAERELKFDGVDGYDKQPDFILVDTNGFIDLMEIKKPSVRVLSIKNSYRNNYIPSRELSGTVQQIEKYIFCLKNLNSNHRIFNKLNEKLPKGLKASVVEPRGILLLGRSCNFNPQEIRDFELIKRQYKNIADIMTYDDLIDRFERIIDYLSD